MAFDVREPAFPFDAFAGLIGRLRLNQSEVRRMLAVEGEVRILPRIGEGGPRTASLVAALKEALDLVGDDRLVARWLRTPLLRRGGVTPLEEVGLAKDDVQIRFVLRPDPTELVRVVNDVDGYDPPVSA